MYKEITDEDLKIALDQLSEALKPYTIDLDPIALGDPSVEVVKIKTIPSAKLKTLSKKVCECGADKCKTTHADYCPKYRK